jgi:hypothetical protein
MREHERGREGAGPHLVLVLAADVDDLGNDLVAVRLSLYTHSMKQTCRLTDTLTSHIKMRNKLAHDV